MTVKTLSGAMLAIGPAITSDTDTLAEFEALAYVDVGEVEDYGEMGDESPLVPFAAVGDGRVRQSKGARNAGAQTFIVGRDPLDAGQTAMKAAEATKFEYALRITMADAPSPLYSNTIFYYRGLVSSARIRMGQNDNIVRDVYVVAVNSKPLEDPAALLP